MPEKSKETESDFGAGFTYSLFLFAKHWGLIQSFREFYRKTNLPEDWAYGRWFFGASDHLIDLKIPEAFKGTKVEMLVDQLKRECSGLVFHPFRTSPKKSFEKVFNNLEKIFILIDKEFGINAKKAKYE